MFAGLLAKHNSEGSLGQTEILDSDSANRTLPLADKMLCSKYKEISLLLF